MWWFGFHDYIYPTNLNEPFSCACSTYMYTWFTSPVILLSICGYMGSPFMCDFRVYIYNYLSWDLHLYTPSSHSTVKLRLWVLARDWQLILRVLYFTSWSSHHLSASLLNKDENFIIEKNLIGHHISWLYDWPIFCCTNSERIQILCQEVDTGRQWWEAWLG